LLIGISVAMAGAVFTWLRFSVQNPLPQESCPDISIIIYNYSCNTAAKSITLNVQNRGLFNVSGFAAKMNDRSENETGGSIAGKYFLSPKQNETSIGPAEIKEFIFHYILSQIKQIELEPFIGGGTNITLCEKAILKQRIDCTR